MIARSRFLVNARLRLALSPRLGRRQAEAPPGEGHGRAAVRCLPESEGEGGAARPRNQALFDVMQP